MTNLTLAMRLSCCSSPCTGELGVGRGLGMAFPLYPQALPQGSPRQGIRETPEACHPGMGDFRNQRPLKVVS